MVDLETISAEEYQQRLLNGSIWHDAFEETSERKKFVHGRNRILIFTTSIPQAVAIGVTKASVAKFWAGTGVLEQGPNGWREIVLSPTQIEAVKPGSFPTIAISGMTLRNLQTVPIVPNATTIEEAA